VLPSPRVTAPFAGKCLLVASEDPELAGLVAGAFSALGAEAVGADGGRAALRALAGRRFDAAVLDLPVSDVSAAEFLAELRRARVPAVVLSGAFRGERASDALRRLGARDHLEKPFALDALLGSVANALGTVAAPPEEEPRDEVTGSLPLQAGATPIAAAAFPALDAPAPSSPDGAAAPSREGLAAPLPQPAPGRTAAPDLPPPPSGDLARTSVPRLLVALHVGQATGALTLARGPVKKILVLERGAPTYAASNLAAERFGALCVRRGVVGAEPLEALRRAAPQRRTAELLLEAHLLDEPTRTRLVADQIRGIAWSTFEWTEGSHRFQAGRPPAGRVPVRLDPGELVLEGVRRTSTLPRLRAELPDDVHLAPSPDPAFELYALAIQPAEAHLLTLADGTKSVADLLRLSELPEREARAFLRACRALRILDEVSRVLASTRRTGFM
jgi:CheY-like chemotaxis protein